MADCKLTKSELRQQQVRLEQLEKYLPTLQLKKSLLQGEVQAARLVSDELISSYEALKLAIMGYSALVEGSEGIDMAAAAQIIQIRRRYENIAGVEVPVLEGVDLADIGYSLVVTPPWTDYVVEQRRCLARTEAALTIAKERTKALEDELHEVSIRVNLFEKILIPRALDTIKKIRVFLSDQQLAAVARAKVAKSKIEMRRQVQGGAHA